MTTKTKRILLVNGHPGDESLSRQLLKNYHSAAIESGHAVRHTDISRMVFDADFGQSSYHDSKPLEPDLETFLADLKWSQHVVLAAPIWWGGVPAKLKGLLDRALLPGRSFDPRQTNCVGAPRPLFAGRSARLILTSDTARWALRAFYGDAIIKQIRRQVFEFIGLRPMRLTYFAPANQASEATVNGWFKNMRRLGSRGS